MECQQPTKFNINQEFEIPEEEFFKIGMIIEVKDEEKLRRFLKVHKRTIKRKQV